MPHVQVIVSGFLARQLDTPLAAGNWKRTAEFKHGELEMATASPSIRSFPEARRSSR
jgi:hypothetical protein